MANAHEIDPTAVAGPGPRPESGAPAGPTPPPLPPGLARNLRSFRGRVRATKLTEHAAVAAILVLVSFLVAAGLDRVVVAHPVARAVLFFGAVGAAAAVLWRGWARWHARHRDLSDVAREIALRDAGVGDRLLGVFELTRDVEEFRRSPALVRAAVAQADRDLADRELHHALPPSRHRAALAALAVPALGVLAFAVALPGVFTNALARWALPFADIERMTFARLADVDDQWFVPIEEERTFDLALAPDTRSRPAEARLSVDGRVQRAPREGDVYRITVPPLGADTDALLVVGDLRRTVRIAPRERPEVTAASVSVSLPPYLGIEAPIVRDVRGGSLTVVEGSEIGAWFDFTRDLGRATLEDDEGRARPVPTDGARLALGPAGVGLAGVNEDGLDLTVAWTDTLGLEGHGPFTLRIRTRPDEPPVAALSGLDRSAVLLEGRTTTFEVLSSDDFGVRRVGLEWREIGHDGPSDEVAGTKLLQGGGPEDADLQSLATLTPEDEGLVAGSYSLRAWAADALPGRERAYSSPVEIRVMTEREHADWVTGRLERWVQRAAEVRDRELELRAENRALAALPSSELRAPATQRRLEDQVRAERANRSRLQALVSQGDELLAEAARNDELGAAELEPWAEANRTLGEIADEGMESVARLLAEAAAAAEMPGEGEVKGGAQPGGGASASSSSSSSSSSSEDAADASDSPKGASQSQPGASEREDGDTKMVGENRGPSGGGAQKPSEDDEPSMEDEVPLPPAITDGESSAAGPGDPPPAEEGGAEPPPPSLGLVETTLAPVDGEATSEESEDLEGIEGPGVERPDPVREQIEAAIAAQEKLLAQFEAVAGEIEEVLASLERSTFVKRLKAASRAQVSASDELDVSVSAGFGSTVATSREDVSEANAAVAARQADEVEELSRLHGDLDAYVERLRSRSSEDLARYQRVLDDWAEVRPTMLARSLAGEAEGGRPGAARASAAYLGDTFDRWGEELVPPSQQAKGDKPSQPRDSIAPAVILEILKICEGEVELRDRTREADQAREALVEAGEFGDLAASLWEEQEDLAWRLEQVTLEIGDMPNGEKKFESELQQLRGARSAMLEAQVMLSNEHVGASTIAAETEAIELLLQARRSGGGGGGGGAAAPGGGGGGEATASALALAGRAIGEGDVISERDVDRTQREEISKVPAELRDPLNRYFEALEGN